MSSKFPIGVATIERPLIVLFILYTFIFIISCTPVNLSKQDPKIFQENIPPKKQIVDKSKNNIVEKTEYQEEITLNNTKLHDTVVALFAKDDDLKLTNQFLNTFELGIYNLGVKNVDLKIE